MKYRNLLKYGGVFAGTLGALVLTFAPVGILTSPIVGGLLVACVPAAVVGAIINFNDTIKNLNETNDLIAKIKAIKQKPKPRRSPRLKAKAAKDIVVKNAKSASESVSNGFSSAWKWVKSWFASEKAAKPAEKVSPKAAPKAVAKPVTPAFAKAKGKAKPAAAPAARPARERKPVARYGF